uniref:VASt domain-containing protein n=1 Tax=Strongyloides papillosus TaxID=174720 RepID=A0A0N5B1R2_STREA
MGIGPSAEVKETVNIITQNNQNPSLGVPNESHLQIKNILYSEVLYWTKSIFAHIGLFAVIYHLVRCCLKNSICWKLTSIFTYNSCNSQRATNPPAIEMGGVRSNAKKEEFDEVKFMIRNEMKEIFDSYIKA